jgi:hypothetical protein
MEVPYQVHRNTGKVMGGKEGSQRWDELYKEAKCV